MYDEKAIEYKEVLAKIQTLNVLTDSNSLLRDERDRLKAKVHTPYSTCTVNSPLF